MTVLFYNYHLSTNIGNGERLTKRKKNSLVEPIIVEEANPVQTNQL